VALYLSRHGPTLLVSETLDGAAEALGVKTSSLLKKMSNFRHLDGDPDALSHSSRLAQMIHKCYGQSSEHELYCLAAGVIFRSFELQDRVSELEAKLLEHRADVPR
jgi:hypothetical protein